jgi:hypothetical protein
MAAHLDITLRRNADWPRIIKLRSGGEPIDITGMTVAMQVRTKLDQALVAKADIEIIDPANGTFQVTLRGSSFDGYGSPIQTVNLPYDLRLTDSDGISIDLVAGLVILTRGETHQ